MSRARLILHGKQSTNEELRAAVATVRDEGLEIDVRVTWEAGDAGLLAAEASRSGIERVIAGGGDGTVNEVLNGLLDAGHGGAMGILPLGTANDFARSAEIPLDLEQALRLALTTAPTRADVGRAGSRCFLNVATGGFGTEITVTTDPRLKKHLGGAAYFLTGISRFASIEPTQCRFSAPNDTWEGELLVLAIGNGRQAGGGHPLCPDACIDDGLLDVAILPVRNDIPVAEALAALVTRGSDAIEDLMIRWRVPWVEVEASDPVHVNLDGEPIQSNKHRFDVDPGRIGLVLPADSPLLSRAD